MTLPCLLRRAGSLSLYLWVGGILSSPSPAQQAKLQKLTWGNPDQPWGMRRPVTDADRKAVALYRAGTIQPMYATNFADAKELLDNWNVESEDASNMRSCRRPENVVTTPNGLQLRTLVATQCKAKWSTGYVISKRHYKFGYFEAEIKAADINGLNNAFWLVTEDHFEIDVSEIHFPNINRVTLHNNNNWATETIRTNHSIHTATDIRFSTALMDSAGVVPDHPEGHHMYVKSLKVLPLQ